MLLEIHPRQFIESKDIYLIDNSEYASNELLVYINQHPKVPVIIRGNQEIKRFTDQIRYLLEQERNNAKHSTQNEQETSQDTLEQFD